MLTCTSVPDVEDGAGLLRPPPVGGGDGARVLALVRLGHAREGEAASDHAPGVALPAHAAVAAATPPPLDRRPARPEVSLDDAVEL